MPNPSYDLYFEQLAGEKPEDVCKRALCEYDAVHGCYKLTMWGQNYEVFPKDNRIDRVGANPLDSGNYKFLFILQYLLNAKDIEIQNQWISEKDIPGGPTFFRGPHEIPTRLISRLFENDLEGFKNRSLKLQGSPMPMGDAAFWFEITPRIPVAVLYWIGDEDFPAEAKILFDKTITRHLALDIIFALAVLVCNRIGKS
jgi:hypothetical protein